MAFIVSTLTFDTGLWDSIKKFFVKFNNACHVYGMTRAINVLEQEGLRAEAARLRNDLKVGGIN